MAQNALLAHRSRKGTENVLGQIHKIMKQYGITIQDIENYVPVKIGHNDYIRTKGVSNGWRKQAQSSGTDNEAASRPSTGAVRKYSREVPDEHEAAGESSAAEPGDSK
jgi:hypothetical protein